MQYILGIPDLRIPLPIPHLNATGLGGLVELQAQDVNKRLEKADLQTKTGKCRRLTEAGKQHGEEYPFERNGHSDYRILRRDSVAEIVKATTLKD